MLFYFEMNWTGFVEIQSDYFMTNLPLLHTLNTINVTIILVSHLYTMNLQFAINGKIYSI